MRVSVGVVLTLLVACSGGSSGDDVPTEATCDSLVTAPLGTVPVEEWPEGIDTVKDDVENIEGFYRAFDSCTGKDVQIGITSVIQQEFEIVTTPYTAGAPCGCTQDTEIAPDANLDMNGFIPRFTFVVDNVGDPFVNGFIFELDGATYTPSESVLLRACTTAAVDPETGSLFRTADLVVRMSQNRMLEAEIILDPLDGGEDVVCELTDFEAIN
ncbi:MAG: hypothetical protein AAF211_04520 [Myxococcota bacterium]